MEIAAVVLGALITAHAILAQETPPAEESTPAQLFVTVLEDDGSPIRGATVSVVVGDKSEDRSTNSSGLARFTTLQPGEAIVQVTLAGWSPAGSRVTLRTGKRSNLEISLEPHQPPNHEEEPEEPAEPDEAPLPEAPQPQSVSDP